MDFKSIIRSQAEDMEAREARERLIPREDAGPAMEAIVHPNILVVSGVRRSGKSVFSHQISKGRVSGRINFDDERLAGARTEDLDRILQAFYELYGELECVVLDEVQQVPGWELFASRLRNRMRVVITGSNASLLGGELATRLTGRYIDTVLFPFSFREHLAYVGVPAPADPTTRERAAIVRRLEDYMRAGGFPEVQTIGKGILPRIFGDIVSRDVVKRYRVRRDESLRALAAYLVENAASEVTVRRLVDTLDLRSEHTAAKWMSHLREAFLLFEVERFSYKMRERHLAPRKIFCIDNGIVSTVSSSFSTNTGRLMENLVAVELKRRCAKDWGAGIFYWKDHQQNEVDFIVKKGPRVDQLIQVTYASEGRDVRDRELGSMLKASEALRCRDLLVITWDHAEVRRVDGRKVAFVPLWRWLLGATTGHPGDGRGRPLAGAGS